jgi:hypothetical protein
MYVTIHASTYCHQVCVVTDVFNCDWFLANVFDLDWFKKLAGPDAFM